MSRDPRRLVILGSSTTALAVARHAAQLGIRPIVLDTERGIACYSRHVRAHVLPGGGAGALDLAIALGRSREAALIATSDTWLRRLSAQRDRLSAVFRPLLHPRGEALQICLDKASLAAFCEHHGLPAPRRFRLAADGGLPEAIEFPVFLRPRETRHELPNVPKALELHSRDALGRWLRTFSQARVEPVITRSLLGRRLLQVSVAAARRADGAARLVALEKRRPDAASCAVGSYVALIGEHPATALAHRALDAMDYTGLAEVEILWDLDTREGFLVEINARPWTQYGLLPAAGIDLLGFALGRPGALTAATPGATWMNVEADLFNRFSRSARTSLGRHDGLRAWLADVTSTRAFAHWSRRDPIPFAVSTTRFLPRLARFGLGRLRAPPIRAQG